MPQAFQTDAVLPLTMLGLLQSRAMAIQQPGAAVNPGSGAEASSQLGGLVVQPTNAVNHGKHHSRHSKDTILMEEECLTEYPDGSIGLGPL